MRGAWWAVLAMLVAGCGAGAAPGEEPAYDPSGGDGGSGGVSAPSSPHAHDPNGPPQSPNEPSDIGGKAGDGGDGGTEYGSRDGCDLAAGPARVEMCGLVLEVEAGTFVVAAVDPDLLGSWEHVRVRNDAGRIRSLAGEAALDGPYALQQAFGRAIEVGQAFSLCRADGPPERAGWTTSVVRLWDVRPIGAAVAMPFELPPCEPTGGVPAGAAMRRDYRFEMPVRGANAWPGAVLPVLCVELPGWVGPVHGNATLTWDAQSPAARFELRVPHRGSSDFSGYDGSDSPIRMPLDRMGSDDARIDVLLPAPGAAVDQTVLLELELWTRADIDMLELVPTDCS